MPLAKIFHFKFIFPISCFLQATTKEDTVADPCAQLGLVQVVVATEAPHTAEVPKAVDSKVEAAAVAVVVVTEVECNFSSKPWHFSPTNSPTNSSSFLNQTSSQTEQKKCSRR